MRRLFVLLPLLLLGCPKVAEEAGAPEPEKKNEAAAGIAFEAETLELAGLELATATATETGTSAQVTGVLEADPAATAIVTARVEGKIIRLIPSVGDAVAAGATVAIVESEKLHEAQLAHALAVKRLDAAQSDLARRRELARLGAYGRPGLEEARKGEAEALAALEHARGEARSAETALKEARSKLLAQQAQSRQAETALTLAQSRLALAETQLQRSERLFAEQLISRREQEEALAQKEKALSEERHARAEQDAVRARRKELEAGIESALVKSQTAAKAIAPARKRLDLARQTKARDEAIYRGGFLTSREVAEAEAAVAQAKVSAEGALDDVRLLGGQPGDNHSIPVHAPLAGRVLERKATLGQTIHAGEPILTLVDPRTLFARLSVFPDDLALIRPGRPVALKISGRTISGTIDRLGEVADEKTRAVRVRVRVDNAAGRLRPGMPVVARLLGVTRSVVRVPSGAVQTHDGRRVVYVPGEKPGVFLARPVRTGVVEGGWMTILSGLKPGEKFVAKNAFLVKSQAMKSELGEEE